MKTLVIGARPYSLGAAIADRLVLAHAPMESGEVYTAGINDEEDYYLSVIDRTNLQRFFETHTDFDNVVCTAGINYPTPLGNSRFGAVLDHHLATNVIGPLEALSLWWRHGRQSEGVDINRPRQFVVISSNSSTIPRTNSVAYCASKAALSQGIRCAARDISAFSARGTTEEWQEDNFPLVYGYEFGLLKGTPMSGDRAGSRMLRQPSGLDPTWAAQRVVEHLLHPNSALNGTLLRYDENEV